MIGYVGTGSSFFDCLRYCLQDKKELSEQQKNEMALRDGLQHKERAEVLAYNQCFGSAKELSRQFKDVAKLSRRIEKPVFHFALRLAPDENLSRNDLAEIGRQCAREFGVADHQYVCVLHKDTWEQHIHVVANRVSFDGKVASDGNSYKRMAALCRRLEKQYNLKEVLSPRAFLSAKERQLPRQDSRKEKLRTDIREALEQVHDYPAFERQMKALGYQVIKGRGISFIDDKKVKIKGSEVGFSLVTIERVLHLKNQLEAVQVQQKTGQATGQPDHSLTGPQKRMQAVRESADVGALIQRELGKLLDNLFKSDTGSEYVDPELLREAKKKKKRLRQGL